MLTLRKNQKNFLFMSKGELIQKKSVRDFIGIKNPNDFFQGFRISFTSFRDFSDFSSHPISSSFLVSLNLV